MNRTLLVIFLIAFTIFFCGCFWEKKGSIPDKISGATETGSLGMKMQFTDLGKVLSKAPAGVVNIRIGIAGKTFSELFDAASGQGIVEGVPVGSHVITAAGLDSSGNMQFYGETSAVVGAGEVTPVNILLSSTGSMNINNNAASTGTLTVTLYMTAPFAIDMMISNNPLFTAAVWEPYSTTKNWSLMSGLAGTRNVYVKFKNSSGTVTSPISDSIDFGALPANTILVDKYAPGITQDGGSWATAYKTLQQALAISSPGDSIWISAGEYTPEADAGGDMTPGDIREKTFCIGSGVALYGGFSGFLGGQETTLTSRNWVANNVTLSGDIGIIGDNTDNCYHVVYSEACTIDGVSIKFGRADAVGYDDGGGVHSVSGFSPSIYNSIISNNYAENNGGGIYGDSTYTLSGCTFENNTSSNNGGAIMNMNATLTMSNCGFSGNIASTGAGIYNQNSGGTYSACLFVNNNATGGGGGIYNISSSNPSISGTTFYANSGPNGGGMNNFNSNPNISNCDFELNTASNGAGMFNRNAQPVIENTDFVNNDAAVNGGGIVATTGSVVKITGGIFTLNDAPSGLGGGIMIFDTSIVEIRNASFETNSAVYGGAISMDEGSLICLGTRFRSNSGNGGAAVKCYDGTPVFNNCVFENNQATDGSGGALLLEEDINGPISPIVAACVFDRNAASSNGGAISFNGENEITINGCTFANNTSASGGSIYLGTSTISFAMVNSIMYHTAVIAAGDWVFSAAEIPLEFRFNDIKDGWNGAGMSGSGSTTEGDATGSNIDFLPAYSGENSTAFGGLVPTCVGGPIDGADTGSALVDVFDVDDNGNMSEYLPIDAAGNPRYVNGSTHTSSTPPEDLDMGAYEMQ